MSKKPTVTTITTGYSSADTLNENFEALRDGFDNTLSLDGSTPNAMEADLDLNGNNIIGAAGLLVNGTDYLADVTAAKAAALAAQAAAETAETNAETAETNAESSETAAGLSATAAATSATASAASAVDATNNGAAQVALAAAQVTLAETAKTAAELAETNAETAESNAATSATNAATSETNASTSASTASTKASEAATSATNAATSATEAETAKTAAETARDSALAALDSFDDRYLGVKASDPTVDNDGDALVVGAIYFNSNTDLLYVYNGTTWQVTANAASGDLVSTNNLSDLTSAATARTNLGLGTAATTASTDYATAAQGALADTATQPADLGTAAAADTGDFATAAQGTLADSAVQPNDSPTFGTVTADGLTVDVADGDGVLLSGGAGSFSEASYYFAQGERARFGYNGSRVSISDYSNSGVTSNKSLSIELGGAERFFINHTTGDISFYEDTGTTPKFFWDASAEALTIGDAATQAPLSVETNSSGFAISIEEYAGAETWQIGVDVDGDLNFHNSTLPTPQFTLNDSGNVGIGKTPATALDVNGTVTATSYAGDGSSLTGIAAGAGGGGSDEIFWENGQNVTTNYTITNGKNAMSAGPITINSGVTVTVGAGETWTVV